MKTQALFEQALARHRSGDLAAAEALYRKLVRRTPNHGPALNELGNIALVQGRPADALPWYLKAVAHDRRNPGFAVNLAMAYLRADRMAEGLAALDQALALSPDNASWRRDALVIALRIGALESAARHAGYLAATGQENDVSFLCSAATAVATGGKLPLGLGLTARIVMRHPDSALAASIHGALLLAAGTMDEAGRWIDRALHLDPGEISALINRTSIDAQSVRVGRALADLRAVLALDPASADAHANLSSLQHRLGNLAEAVRSIDRTLALTPLNAEYRRRRLLFKVEMASPDADDEARATAAWFSGGPPAPTIVSRPGDRLRIGCFSPDFRSHSCAWFLMPLFEHRDRQRIDLLCYSGVGKPDRITAWFEEKADGWCDAIPLDDARLAERIAADRIDVLVDLAGLTAGHRADLFRRRPAPVQVNWLGYNGTTASSEIDWKLVDDWLAPPDRPIDWFSEGLWRLPRLSHCWRPPEQCPPVALPDPRPVTFGSFNNLGKLSPATIAAWAEILNRTDGTRLVLKGPSSGDRFFQQRLLSAFAARGVDPGRIRILDYAGSLAEHLALYAEIDIALDPFPYNGTTTTCEALWMGLPVVSLAGARLLGRVGVSLLSAVGLDDLVADDVQGYVDIAAGLAADHDRRRGIRQGLRQRMASSPLRDEAGFAGAMEAAFAAMHRRQASRAGAAI